MIKRDTDVEVVSKATINQRIGRTKSIGKTMIKRDTDVEVVSKATINQRIGRTNV